MIFVNWHLGLGDAIVCAPIIAKLSETFEQVVVPSYEHNKVSVESFFNNYENVKVVTHPPDLKKFQMILNLGFNDEKNPKKSNEDFVQWFYHQAEMDISVKSTHCPIKEAIKKTEQLKIFRSKPIEKFLHDDKERDFNIKREGFDVKTTFEPINKKDSILQYATLMNEVNELHCIDSSFLHLAEALNVPCKKVYHKYARPESTEYNYLKGWEVINDRH